MQVDNEYLHGLGVGLQGLRASGQFCDAMVCVGSTRILVHKVVLSAASKTLHDLALDFDMMPHRERDQLEIVIPPDISLYAVNMFINFIYTGQLELNSRVVGHMERLATLFGISPLITQCREFIQKSTTPDSQNLNLRTVSQTEADSSLAERRLSGTPDASSHYSELSRSNSACSGFSGDIGLGHNAVNIKTEPPHLANFESSPSKPSTGSRKSVAYPGSSKSSSRSHGPQSETSMSVLEKLMSPVVNLQKLPSNITPDVVVLVSDNESENDDNGDTANDDDHLRTNRPTKPAHQYSLSEKEAIAIEAKRYGTTQVSRSHNIPLPDILSWMTLFGLRNPGNQRLEKRGKQADLESDLSLVRWIVQQQEMNGCVDLDNMKQYALTVHKQTNPKFCASKTWLGNFLQRNMSVLQGIKFVHSDKTEVNIYSNMETDEVVVKQEVLNRNDSANSHENVLENLGESAVLENVPLNEETMVNEAIMAGFNDNFDDEDNDEGFTNDSFSNSMETGDLTNSYISAESSSPFSSVNLADQPTTQGSIVTPFGKRPIIVGQSKSLDAKSERKIVQWVLEKQAKDGFVFTDDFKNFARSLYKGEKHFGATQCWMKKFLRRNRALKDIKFCSKFKNTYTSEEKLMAVTMAKRFGVAYAAKHSGIGHKIIHNWKLSSDKGLLNLEPQAQMNLNQLDMPVPDSPISSSYVPSIETPSTSHHMTSSPTSVSTGQGQPLTGTLGQASHGMVPEFEEKIIQEIKELQAQEGSVNYNDISRISQAIYKETRPSFKACYKWVRSFLERHAADLVGIELENVSKVLVENEKSLSEMSSQKITEMVDEALKVIGKDRNEADIGMVDSEGKKIVRPVIIGPSVMFDRKTEKKLVEWALERQQQEGYVFTDDFKLYAKSLHTGPKHFSASSGWMTLFLRRHRVLKDVKWKSKFKNNYTEEEKMAAVLEAKRLGTGHVARQLGIDSSLLCAWRIKMDKSVPKQQTFWKGTKIKKFGKAPPKFHPLGGLSSAATSTEACRGVVPEFEKRIVDLIHEEHQKEGSISYEEISRLAQSVYKETRPLFKASYAWIRNFMKRNEHQLNELDIENVKKVLYEEEGNEADSSFQDDSEMNDFQLKQLFQKRPIIVGQSRSLDTKTEKKLVQWVVEQQQKNGYVFLDQFKKYAQSLYKGEKKFSATRAWQIKFLRRNHAALKHVQFTSSFRNQYTLEEKKVIVQESKKFGAAHVSKKTGIDHCLINQWRLKLERTGVIPADTDSTDPSNFGRVKPVPSTSSLSSLTKLKSLDAGVGPGLYSSRGIVPTFERKIIQLIMNKMDEEGSVTYGHVSMIARAVYKETRPTFKASYNWIKDFIKRNKKELRHVEFETTNKSDLGGDLDIEVLIPEDNYGDMNAFLEPELPATSTNTSAHESDTVVRQAKGPMIVIDNPEDPNYDSHTNRLADAGHSGNLDHIPRRPIIIGKARHFTRKDEKKIVEWLLEHHERDGFVFTDDLRRYARSLYTGEPGKFGATNAWIQKFLRRNRLENKIEFQSRLIGNNPKFESQIIDLILEQQEKEGSVSNDDIQKITMSVYKETRPNFRACYNWIKGFIKRHKDRLVNVELENVKKVYIPDENEKDGVLIRDYDPSMSMQFIDNYSDSNKQGRELSNQSFEDENSLDNSWVDMDISLESATSSSFTSPSTSQSQNSIIDRLAKQKRPIIIAPPKSLDSKTERKLVQWMVEQQGKNGCVYLDLFKQYAKSIHTGPKHFGATQGWMVKFKQRNREALKNIVMKSRFRNEYSMEEKVAIVEEAKRLGCNHVGRKLGINGGVIYSWKVQLENSEKMADTSVNLTDSFDTGDYDSARGVVPEFEKAIVNMVLETQRAKGSVSNDDVCMCARSVYQETRPNFKASYNWIMDFIRKYEDEFKSVVFENKKRVITEEEKLHILSEEKKYGTDHVIKKRNISQSTLRHWKRQFLARSVPIPKFKAIVSSKIKKKYAKKQMKMYSLEEKRKVVAEAEKNGITHTSLKLGVSRTMLGKWIRYFRDQGEQIVINFTPTATLKKELVQTVVAWVLEQNDEIGIVLTQRVQDFAKKCFEESFTNCSATSQWLESFLTQNREKFEKVRFRDKGDRDLEFTDEVKLKLCRHAEKHGAVATANLTGLLPKMIYNWRRVMKQKGHDLSVDLPATVVKGEPNEPECSEPKSLMQQKLDKIAAKFDIKTRKQIVAEASVHGTSAIASKHKIPLPLILKWMKVYVDGGEESRESSVSRSASISSEDMSHQDRLKIKLPSVEKMSAAVRQVRITKDLKKQAIESAKKNGVRVAVETTGVGLSTLYSWLKDERDSSVESSRDSVERPGSSARSSLDRESLTPIAVKDIKSEPVSSYESPSVKPSPSNSSSPRRRTLSNDSSSSFRYSSFGETPSPVIPKKVTRKYSDEQKLEVAQRGLEIGAKKASQELNIPFSNVKRWMDNYRGGLTSAGKSKPIVITPSIPKSTPVGFVIRCGAERKRKAVDSPTITPGSLGYKRPKYSDEERIKFVKMSESMGTTSAANTAGVTLDVLYKWRSKYLPGIRLAAATGAHNDEEELESHDMPEPRKMQFDPSERFKENVKNVANDKEMNDGLIDNNDSSVTERSQNKHGADSGIIENEMDESVIPSASDFHDIMDDDSNYPLSKKDHLDDLHLQMTSSEPIVNIPDETHDAPVQSIDDNDIIAADQILELMDAEKQQVAAPNTAEPRENVDAENSVLPADDVDGHAMEDSTPTDLGMIKIVNVKSEAPIH